MSDFKTIKTKTIVSVLFCLAALGLFMGGNIMAVEENQKNIFVLPEGNESHITVAAPGEFAIKIESNPTTGYGWALVTPREGEDSPVKFKEQKVAEPGDRPKEEARLGAPTYEIFTFEALAPGEALIELHYRRPWEKDVPPIKKHKIVVTVE